MKKVHCNYSQRQNIILYTASKYFTGIELVPTTEVEKTRIGDFSTIISFLESLENWSYKCRLGFLSSWKIGMSYPEIQRMMPRIEETALSALSSQEKSLLFSFLHSEMIFVNLVKSKKLNAFPKLEMFYRDMYRKEEETLKEYERKKKTENKAEDKACFDIGLPPKYKVVTRFPPEPSGYLHIGHAKAALLNSYFADQYNGSMIVRMDDTNPANEKEEYEKTIMEDLALLGIEKYKTTRSSDYFDLLIEKCKYLIEKGLAYCDDTPVEQMRSERDKGIHSSRREQAPEKNMKVFNGMIQGNKYDEYCVRAKISMDNLNKAMRDPVIYRVNIIPHYHTGKKYRVYPTYDFACPIIDSIEGVTLSLRTNEYRDRNVQYMWFISALDLSNRPIIWDFSRLNFKYTILSKRKLRWFVEQKKVSGWCDPRMPTVRGILRRGLCKEALKEYIILQGPSRNTVLLSWDKLWAINAQKIDKIARRIHGLEKNDLVSVTVAGIQEKLVKMEDRDNRTLTSDIFISQTDVGSLDIGKEIVLMGVGSFKVMESNPVKLVESSTLPRNIRTKVTWVPADRCVPAKVIEYKDLITVEKPEDQSMDEIFNNASKIETEFLCDERVELVQEKQFVQIEKRGFFYCDKKDPLTLHLVPETKQNKN